MAVRPNEGAACDRADELTPCHTPAPLRVPLTEVHEPRGEGVGFGTDGMVFLTGEGGVKGEPGTFNEAGVYTFRSVVDDDLGGMSFEEAIDGTIVNFDDGDIVTGIVVKVDKDEVLLDIGFKSEGVIPARELSIRHDVDPHEIVTMGEKIEALVL